MFPPLPIVLVADDPLVRGGLEALLPDEVPVLRALGSDADVDAAVLAARAEAVLWDASDAVPASLELSVPVVALVREPGDATRALAAGAAGVLLRDGLDGRLVAALIGARAKLRVIDERLPDVLRAGSPTTGGDGPTEPLTAREEEVLALLAEGRSNREIATALAISPHTAKFHVDRILLKLDASSRTDAVVRAVRLGLLVL